MDYVGLQILNHKSSMLNLIPSTPIKKIHFVVFNGLTLLGLLHRFVGWYPAQFEHTT
jgi:hypothetical protein